MSSQPLPDELDEHDDEDDEDDELPLPLPCFLRFLPFYFFPHPPITSSTFSKLKSLVSLFKFNMIINFLVSKWIIITWYKVKALRIK